MSSIFLCNNQTSIFSEYNQLCYINVGGLSKTFEAYFASLNIIIKIISLPHHWFDLSRDIWKVVPPYSYCLNWSMFIQNVKKKICSLTRGLSAEALISSKGNSFRSFISVSLFKFSVLLTVTIFGSFLILGSLACLII